MTMLSAGDRVRQTAECLELTKRNPNFPNDAAILGTVTAVGELESYQGGRHWYSIIFVKWDDGRESAPLNGYLRRIT